MSTKGEQARARLVEIALATAKASACGGDSKLCRCDPAAIGLTDAHGIRRQAGFRDASKGHWCAAGLAAAMAQAGLLVPAPGTQARRGAIALLDWVQWQHAGKGDGPAPWRVDKPPLKIVPRSAPDAQPGDIIAWLQHPPPDPAGWRRGHVAVIVAVDDISLTTVGWNEGPSPGRVMMRRLCRRQEHEQGYWRDCPVCDPDDARQSKSRADTVLWRRPGGLYGIARPVAA
jgi:hypothetical protein